MLSKRLPRTIYIAMQKFTADSRRGFRTSPSIGNRRGMRITDDSRSWLPLFSTIYEISRTNSRQVHRAGRMVDLMRLP